MATYRLEAKIIGRSSGRSATASAAYRAAERVDDERTGQSFDYTRKRGVLHSEILAPPDDTPAWMRDRAQLWNAVEKVEKRKDAQLARDLILSLPHELTSDQRRDLVREFVRSEFVAQGMIADLAIHAPDRRGDDRNHHAHVMLTMRELTGDGFGKKVREWNDTAQLEQWREDWAKAVNLELERHGHAARVDHRSLEEQGVDREPEPKQGPIATQMEREGRPSHAGDDRRAAQERNEQRAALAAELQAVTAEIIDLEQERVKRAGEDGMSDNRSLDEALAGLKAAIEQRERLEAQRATPGGEDAPDLDEANRIEAQARENVDHQVRQAEEMRDQRTRIDEFEAGQKRQAEEALKEQERQREADSRGEQAEGEIRDAGDRYRIALGDNYDMRDPYGSLAKAAMAEYGDFIRDREQLNAEIAQEQDPQARKLLELRRDIEANDYMAITSERIAGQSEVITGRSDSEEAVRFRERAGEYAEQSQELRQQYRELASDRADRETEQEQPADRDEERSGPEVEISAEDKPKEHDSEPEQDERIRRFMEQMERNFSRDDPGERSR